MEVALLIPLPLDFCSARRTEIVPFLSAGTKALKPQTTLLYVPRLAAETCVCVFVGLRAVLC
jgi:hypothetical protein